MRAWPLALLSLVCLLVLNCKRKYEIVPSSALHVERADSLEKIEAGEVALREYRFDLPYSSKHKAGNYLCESRSYPTAESALVAAKSKIAERPNAQTNSSVGRLASSGRSIWLQKDNKLTWCMLTNLQEAKEIENSMQALYKVFQQRLEESK